MHPMLNIAIKAARSAGNIIVRFMDRLDAVNVSEKGRNDLVTEVDKASEQEIIQIIKQTYPDHAILSEETGSVPGNDFRWVIDPLDGTMNYVHGFPQFAISIALQIKNRTEIALIYDPVRQEFFTAVRGRGAQLNNRRIRVSNRDRLIDSLIGTGFPFRDKENFDNYLKAFSAIFPNSAGVRRAGSAALDLAYVAAGRLDGFWEGALKIWDMAAGALLIEEAGGMVSDFHGGKNYLQDGNIVAGNPKIFRILQDTIKKTQAS